MEKLISEFSFGLFFWHLLVFVGLIFLLKKFAWKPILDTINERETSIRDALKSAENARSEMELAQADNKKILKEALIEKEKILKEANDIKSKTINESKDIAKIEADKIIKQAENLIQAEKNAVINDLKDQVAELSINIAEKVLKDELNNKAKHEKLVERLLKESNIK
ncbi:MAG: F0F1 ATP synthase subunit B [Flavobacteriaceae bacterium]|nr:MAG: F0F1 ATP synthase subunit B [Flavobacteriaceae bacterium TMED220]